MVAQSGLSWTDAAELQRTSLVLCEACRRCIPVRMRVGANTPRAVWARTDVVGGGGGISGGGGLDSRCERGGGTGSGGGRRTCGVGGSGDDSDWRGIAANSKSRKLKGKRQRREQGQQQQQLQPQPNQQQQTGEAERRIAPRLMRQLRILSLVWEAPAIHLGDGSGLPAELTELTFCRDFNRPLSGIQWPPKLARLTFGSKFNRHLSAEVGCRPGLPGRQRVPGSKLPPSGAAGACGGSGSDSAANRCHDDGGHNRKTRDKCAPRDTADTGEGDAAIDDSRMDHHGTDHHHRHHHRSDLRHGSDHHGKRGTQSELSLLPGSLKDLTLGKQFNKPLPRSSLPPGLVSLTLGRNFHHHGSVRDAVWPSGLKVCRVAGRGGQVRGRTCRGLNSTLIPSFDVGSVRVGSVCVGLCGRAAVHAFVGWSGIL